LTALAGVPDTDRLELARVASRVENAWVGARTGLLDQIASLLGRDGHALRIDFRTLAVTAVPLDLRGWRLVTVGSGEARAQAASEATSSRCCPRGLPRRRARSRSARARALASSR